MSHTTLANGLEVVVAPLDHLHGAAVTLHVKVGSRYEDERTNGLSHFLEHMVFRGSKPHPSTYELNLAMEELGGMLNGATHVDYTVYYTAIPPRRLRECMALFGEMVRSPLFQDVEIEKGVVREEILEGLDEEGRDIDADNVVRRLFFGKHPLGFKITGTLATVQSFTEDDLRAHLTRYYRGCNMVLSVAGAVDPRQVVAWAEESLGDLEPGERLAPGTVDLSGLSDRFAYVEDDGSQADIRVSFPALGLHEPRYAAQQMLLRILDDGLSSRLHRRLCDERGLAYDTFASLEPYEDSGILDLGASVAHDKVPAVVGELLTVVRELRDGPIEPRELSKSRERYLWDLESMLDDAAGLASYYGANTLLRVERSLSAAADAASSVTAEAVRDVAHAVFRAGEARVACVGMLDDDLVDRTQAALDELD